MNESWMACRCRVEVEEGLRAVDSLGDGRHGAVGLYTDTDRHNQRRPRDLRQNHDLGTIQALTMDERQ